MAATFILPLADAQADLAAVGGKGASLARLSSAGLPVPSGFHVTTAAYQAYVQALNLSGAIAAALQSADPAKPATLDFAADTIRALFAAPIPPQMADAIYAAYTALPQGGGPVAVRSSATAEDLPDLSFAGQQETFLNISGAENVLEAVRRCWASLWTPRAIGYRQQHGIDHNAVSMGVVVQQLIPAEAAGILFTADPVTGRRDRTLISAAWGLGEAVVGGLVTPDALVVDKASGRVIERQTADKQVMTVRLDGHTEEQPVPPTLRTAPVLDDAHAAALTRLGTQIEDLYGLPVDVEWALAGGKFTILQARPVTALPAEAEPEEGEPGENHAPLTWERPDPQAFYARGSLAEHLPNPVSPLYGTLGLRLANAASIKMVSQLYTNDDYYYGYFPINGYVYSGMKFRFKDLVSYISATFKVIKMLRTANERWDEDRGKLAAVVERFERQPVEEMSAACLLEGAGEILLETMNYYTTIQSGTLPAASMSEALFTSFYKLVRRKDDPDVTAFLFGFDTAPLRAEKSLYDLAQWLRGQPSLAGYLASVPAAQLVSALPGSQAPASVDPAAWTEFQQRFAAHLYIHAKTAYELDIANPVPAERPEPLIEMLKVYLADGTGAGSNPYERQRAAVQRRESAAQQMLARLHWPLRGWFVRLLNWVEQQAAPREDSLSELGTGNGQVRRLLGELGRRLQTGGAIGEREDIYWLEESEVAAWAKALDSGEPTPDLSARVNKRRADWRRWQRATPPAVVPQRSALSKIMPWTEDRKEKGNEMKGIGTSAGVVTAPACVLLEPDDFPKMRPGAVLVAVTTTPAWTPLFTLASAVVTDIGGPLSHSSIVAREYGIPAVTATGIGTRKIRDGQMLTVDGKTGRILLHD